MLPAIAAVGAKLGLSGILSKIGATLFASKLSTAATTYFGSKLLGL